MSLLNDALRAAEQRQGRPDVSSVYTGQVNRQPATGRWLVPVLALLLVTLSIVAVYGFFFRTPVAEIQVTERTESAESELAVEPMPVPAPEASNQLSDPAPKAEPESELGQTPEPEAMLEANTDNRAASDKALLSETTVSEPEVISPEPQPESEVADRAPAAMQPAPKADAPLNNTKTEGQRQEPASFVSQPAEPAPETERSAVQVQVPEVKQARETVETIDLRVSRELSRLLRGGEFRAAEQKLVDVASNQAAPVSRGVYARAMLLQESPGRALPWVSGEEVRGYPELRLLRARALLSMGRLNEAVTTLSQDVPPVTDNIEYRITLATLTQQAGQNVEAARHWSALIAVDDSQPTWWVGLAIALEAGGQDAGALKAYTQAALLPGLSPSLADYVRNRMTLLQAG